MRIAKVIYCKSSRNWIPGASISVLKNLLIKKIVQPIPYKYLPLDGCCLSGAGFPPTL